MTLKEMKKYLKKLAIDIKNAKSKRKSMPNGYVPELYYLRYTYRYNHIAYCLAKGTPKEKIEHSVVNIDSVWEHFVSPIYNKLMEDVCSLNYI